MGFNSGFKGLNVWVLGTSGKWKTSSFFWFFYAALIGSELQTFWTNRPFQNVWNYQPAAHNLTEAQRPHLHRGRRLSSSKILRTSTNHLRADIFGTFVSLFHMLPNLPHREHSFLSHANEFLCHQLNTVKSHVVRNVNVFLWPHSCIPKIHFEILCASYCFKEAKAKLKGP
jgi:hypothetical protein